jgi:exosortase/archaeosortase family protein
MRVLLFASTVPIAIAANAFRVTVTGILSEYKRDLAEGFFHAVEGWAIFMVALVILILFHQLVNKIYGLTHARN